MAAPQGHPEAYYAPGWGPPPARTDGVSVAALVTGLVGLGPVALGLGLAGLRRTRPGRSPARRGRGLAVAGTVLGAVGTLAVAALAVLAVVVSATMRPLPSDVTAAVQAHAVQLATGHCVGTLPADGEVDRVGVVPCAEPHEAQVVSSYRFDRGADWPGEAAAGATVTAACDLTPAERDAGLRLVAWSPTAASWRLGDRTGLCVLVHPAPVTGSALDGSATPVG